VASAEVVRLPFLPLLATCQLLEGAPLETRHQRRQQGQGNRVRGLDIRPRSLWPPKGAKLRREPTARQADSSSLFTGHCCPASRIGLLVRLDRSSSANAERVRSAERVRVRPAGSEIRTFVTADTFWDKRVA